MINDVMKVILNVHRGIKKIWFCICIWKSRYVGDMYL